MNLVIVTVVKNDLNGLIKTQQSILNQSVPVVWNVVTPFDHSETHQKSLELYGKGHLANIIEDEGNGVYSAMNQAIRASFPQDWLWFLNAGDEFAANNSYQIAFENVSVSYLRWAYGGHFLGSESGQRLGELAAPTEFKVSNQLFSKSFISHQATIFQASFLKELGGFNPVYRIASDWDLMSRASKVEPAMRIKESLSVFYMGGLSTRSRQQSNLELLELRMRHLPKRYLPKSYMWFFYRSFRNKFVQSIERKAPETINFIRRIRLKHRHNGG
jgi:putative colanic acid biosynthesis glycosyltransferase